tara:strand:+ start:70 stop:489 length:420 start_codon:yes stop_codon:yes gene_type:complete
MYLNKKYMILFMSLFLVNLILPNTYPKTDISSSVNELLNINKLEHNFNFSIGAQSDIFGSSSFYSIGDRLTYKFSDKLLFIGDFDLIFSSANFNEFGNSFEKPKLNFDLGFKYNLNENTNFQIRIVKNYLNPNCNTVAF